MLRIGTRRSPLALAQAREVADLLGSRGVDTELVPLLTSGDRDARVAASPFGVKGLFVEEIVRALEAGEVDLAVHSAKDLPAEDPEGVVVAAVPERADPFDVLVTRDGALGDGSVVGTSSLRRRAQLLAWRPGLAVRDIRGNVDTRLRKLSDGDVDALVLAAAGLGRLGLAPDRAERLGVDDDGSRPGSGGAGGAGTRRRRAHARPDGAAVARRIHVSLRRGDERWFGGWVVGAHFPSERSLG